MPRLDIGPPVQTLLRRLAALLVAALVLSSFPAPHPAAASWPDSTPDLEGRWAHKLVETSVSDMPLVPKTTSRTVSYLLVDLRQEGDDLQLVTDTCEVEIDNQTRLVETILPPAFVRAIPDYVRNGRIVREDGETSVEIDRQLLVLGARLRVPHSEWLPTEPDDPRVFDQDDDGHPGMTVVMDGILSGKVYLVQRGWDAMKGSVHSEDRISGPVRWDVDHSVLGATSIFLRKMPDMKTIDGEPESYFELTRIPDDADCRDILKNKSNWFQR